MRTKSPHAVSLDRKSTRLNSSHTIISYAVFCLKKIQSDRKSTRLNSSHTIISYAGFCFQKNPGRSSRSSAIYRTWRRPAPTPPHRSSHRRTKSRPRSCATASFFFNDTATTEIYTLSLHDALPISSCPGTGQEPDPAARSWSAPTPPADRKSTRLNSSHTIISYAAFCFRKKKE